MTNYFELKKQAIGQIDKLLDAIGEGGIGVDTNYLVYVVETKTGLGKRFVLERLKLMESVGDVTIDHGMVKRVKPVSGVQQCL